MNPPTIGHKKLVDKIKAQAGVPFLFLTQSQKPKTDPLSFAENKDVYYAVKEFLPYGQLSGKNLSDLRAGERVEVNDAKKDPLDFVFLTISK